MPSAKEVFEDLCQALSAETLVEEIVLPVEEAREAYEPETLRPSSEEEVKEEVTRFLASITYREYLQDKSWEKVLEWIRGGIDVRGKAIFGGRWKGETWQNAWRMVEKHRLQYVLNMVAKHEQDRLLKFHVADVVRDILVPIDNDTRERVAELYLEMFEDLPNHETREFATNFSLRLPPGRHISKRSDGEPIVDTKSSTWYRMLLDHARAVLKNA